MIPGMTPPSEPGQEEECGGRVLSCLPQGFMCLLPSISSCSSVSDLLCACPHILSGGCHSPTKCCEDPNTVYIWMYSIENCLGNLRKHWCLGPTLKILLYFTWSGAQASTFLKSSPCDANVYLGWEALGQHISGLLCKISSLFCFIVDLVLVIWLLQPVNIPSFSGEQANVFIMVFWELAVPYNMISLVGWLGNFYLWIPNVLLKSNNPNVCNRNDSTLHLGHDLHSSTSFHIWCERYCSTVKVPWVGLEKYGLEFVLCHYFVIGTLAIAFKFSKTLFSYLPFLDNSSVRYRLDITMSLSHSADEETVA